MKDEDLRKAWRDGSWSGIHVEGAYYREQLNKAKSDKRVGKVPYIEGMPVNTYWDLGIGDSTAILFFQNIGQERHWIDTYEQEGEGLPHYARILQEKGYVYGTHYAPHDIEVRELGSGRSRLEVAQSIGINFQIVPRLSIEDGINAVRNRFNTLWIDEEKNKEAIRAVANYHKEFDEKRGTFKNQPFHDWSSHIADALRYWAVAPENNYGGQLKSSYRN